jgi:hypothetical protein
MNLSKLKSYLWHIASKGDLERCKFILRDAGEAEGRMDSSIATFLDCGPPHKMMRN